jgi:hypothetical protein
MIIKHSTFLILRYLTLLRSRPLGPVLRASGKSHRSLEFRQSDI